MISEATASGLVTGTYIALTWVLLALSLAFLGRIALRVGAGRVASDWLSATWLGLGLFIAFIQTWHLVLPANQLAWLPVGIAAMVELLLSRKALISQLKAATLRFAARNRRHFSAGALSYAATIVTTAVVVWIANLCIREPFHYDSGLYHLQIIEWSEKYPIVVGLANLHFRLGFNSAWWPFVASLGVGPWRGYGSHLGNGFVIALLIVTHARAALLLLRDRQPHLDLIFLVILLPVTLSQVSFGWVSSPAYDQPAYAFMVAACGFALQMARGMRGVGATVIVVAIAAALIRLQLAPFALVLTLFVLWNSKAWRTHSGQFRLVGAVLFGASATVVFSVRGILTSGYPFFPLTIGAVPVSWLVPAQIANDSQRDIVNYARGSSSGTSGWSWVVGWFRQNWATSSTIKYGVALLVLALVVALVGIRRREVAAPPAAVIVLAASCSNLILWFLTAPEPRYGLGPIWASGACALAIAVWRIKSRPMQLGLVALVFLALSAQALHALIGSKQLFPQQATGTGPFGLVKAIVPPVRMEGGAVKYWVPISGDQCWATPIPCSPSPQPGLKPRGPHLSDGFMISK